MQLNVPPETDERMSKLASELKPGDWLANDQPTELVEMVSEVLSVSPYADAVGNQKVLVVFRNAYEPSPEIGRWTTTQEVLLATEDEIADARQAHRRRTVASRLHDLADLVQDRLLPIGDWPVEVSFALGDEGLVLEAAMAVGVERVITEHGLHTAFMPSVDTDAAVRAQWYCYGEKPSASGRDIETGDASTPVPEGVEGGPMTGRGADGGCE